MCEICSKLTIKAPERRHDVVLVSQDLGLAILQNLHAVADDFLGTFRICWNNFSEEHIPGIASEVEKQPPEVFCKKRCS